MSQYSKTLLLLILFSEVVLGGTVKIQYSKQKVNDAYVISTSPAYNSSEHEWGWITYFSSNDRIERSFIRIPVPEFISSETAASVTHAELKLYFGDFQDKNSPFSINLHKVEGMWEESSLVWFNQPSFNDTAEVTSIQSKSHTWISFPITELVKTWIGGFEPNYGVMLRSALEGYPSQNTTNFRTSNNDDPAFRPILEISSPYFPDTLITDVSGSPPQNEYNVDENTIALWHFNEGTGTTSLDATANHADAILHNDMEWTSGRFGNAIALDGIDDYLTFENDFLFNFVRGEKFTVEFWIKILSNDQLDNKWIFSKKTKAANSVGYGIWIDSQNFLRARITDTGLIGQPLNGSQLSLNEWHNIVFIRGGLEDGLQFYVDGILVADAVDPTLSLENTLPLHLGRAGQTDNWNSTCINAIIDEVRISGITRAITSIQPIIKQAPRQFSLHQNYPNPFNASTTIPYELLTSGFVTINIYNIAGQKIETLVNDIQETDVYETNFEGSALPSGVYFYTLEVDGRISMCRKMVLLK